MRGLGMARTTLLIAGAVWLAACDPAGPPAAAFSTEETREAEKTSPVAGTRFLESNGRTSTTNALPTRQSKDANITRVFDHIDRLEFLQAQRELSGLLKDSPHDPSLLKLQSGLAKVLAELAGPSLAPLPPEEAKGARRRVAFQDLPPLERLEITALNKQALGLASIPDPVARRRKTETLFAELKRFNLQNTNYFRGWLMQANLAMVLDREIEGQIAARHLLELGVRESRSPDVIEVMARFEKKGWLPTPPSSNQSLNPHAK